jgi:hypothetical protein
MLSLIAVAESAFSAARCRVSNSLPRFDCGLALAISYSDFVRVAGQSLA